MPAKLASHTGRKLSRLPSSMGHPAVRGIAPITSSDPCIDAISTIAACSNLRSYLALTTLSTTRLADMTSTLLFDDVRSVSADI